MNRFRMVAWKGWIERCQRVSLRSNNKTSQWHSHHTMVTIPLKSFVVILKCSWGSVHFCLLLYAIFRLIWYLKRIQVSSASYVRWERDTARICCWTLCATWCCGGRCYRWISSACWAHSSTPTTAHEPVDKWDRQTPFGYIDSAAYCASRVN